MTKLFLMNLSVAQIVLVNYVDNVEKISQCSFTLNYTRANKSSLCNYGILFYFLSELLPLTLLFITILVMNISFTSGAVNGFILFAQVIDLLYIDAYGLKLLSTSLLVCFYLSVHLWILQP